MSPPSARQVWKSWKFEREAWLRFFFAVAGLALAFAAAIYSTVFRQSGNALATAVLASAALLLAGFVALTTVPYLARRVALHRVRQAFDYDITREGMVFIGLILIIGVAALNTGNNLLFIVVSELLAAILVSGLVSAAILRSLEMRVTLPEHVFAGRRARGTLTLENPRRFLPVFSVRVVPMETRKQERGWHWERSEFGFPFNRPRERQWFRLPDRALRRASKTEPSNSIFLGSIYFPFLVARSSAWAALELSFRRRGCYRQEGFSIATRFPFSFLVKTRPMALAQELVVYPPVEPTDEMFGMLPMITGEFETFVRGRGYNLYRIREHQPQDSARQVDWKATAKTGALKVREFTREDERKLRIVFDNPAPGVVGENAYENAISLAASLAWHFSGGDTDLSFAAPGYPGSEDIYEFLRYLALVEPAEAVSVLQRLPMSDDYNIVFTAQPRGSIPTALWASSYFVFMEASAARG